MRPQTALLVALVTGCGDEAVTGAETSASTTGTGTSLQWDSTDWTGDLTDPTTAAGSSSTTGATEVDTTTGEPLVCIMPRMTLRAKRRRGLTVMAFPPR